MRSAKEKVVVRLVHRDTGCVVSVPEETASGMPSEWEPEGVSSEGAHEPEPAAEVEPERATEVAQGGGPEAEPEAEVAAAPKRGRGKAPGK